MSERTDACDPAADAAAGHVLTLVGDIFDAMPMALVVVDPTGHILSINHEAESLLGYSRIELMGRPVEVLVPEALRDRHARDRAGYATAPTARPMGQFRELKARRADGTEVSVEIALKPLATERGMVTLAGMVDVSARWALERHLRDQNLALERRVAERTVELERRNGEMAAVLASLEKAREALDRLSRQDPLTGLMNRREFDERAASELRRAQRRASATCVAMLDLDRFKSVNDRFGHATGDKVLRQIADILRSHCRADDLIGRYGGEEFLLLLPETELAAAVEIVERTRRAIEMHDWARIDPRLTLTVSAGLTACRSGEVMAAVVARADELMYRAKRLGRNRIEYEA